MIGRYVEKFTSATHALPQGMHMNADYPFKLPRIKAANATHVTVIGRSGETRELPIKRMENGDEYAEIQQQSAYEMMFRRKPTKFVLLPFREDA